MTPSQLSQKTSKYSNSTNIEMFYELFLILQNWLSNKKDILVHVDNETLQNNFYRTLLSLNYTDNNDSINDYILIKYSDEIMDMFIKFKDITKSYGSQCLHEKGRTANQLFSFIYDYTIPYTNDDEYLEEEFHIEHTPNYYEEFY